MAMEQIGLEQVISELKAKGVKAGEEEAARLVADARAKAEKIIAEARAEAEATRRKAEADRTQIRAALEAELAQAARVGLASFRETIEKGFVVPEIDAALKAALAKPNVVEETILELVRAFAATGLKSDDVEILLPENRRAELGEALVGKLAARGQRGLTVTHDAGMSIGFKIGPKGGGFAFDLTDEGWREILVRFVAPRFRDTFFAKGGVPR